MARRPISTGYVKRREVVIGACAHCGRSGEIGPEITVLASRDEVHHECWPAFLGAAIKRRAV